MLEYIDQILNWLKIVGLGSNEIGVLHFWFKALVCYDLLRYFGI